MKGLIAVFMAMVILAFSANAALYMHVNADIVNLPEGGRVNTTVTVLNGVGGTPVPNRAIALLEWCKDVAGDPYTCDAGAGDIMSTPEVTVIVNSPTDVNGQATVQLIHNGPGTGVYHYTICDAYSGSCSEGGASVTGDINIIPEFGVLGALAVLGGVALFISKKRNN